MPLFAVKCPQCEHGLEVDPSTQHQVTCPECGQTFALSAPKDPLLGKTLGQFEITEVIGRGGMGTVYKARQESLGRFVALKVLARSISRDAGFVERFRREARAAAAVSHPNIIEVYFVGEHDGHQYMAMEYVDGENLHMRLRRSGPLPADEALDIMKQTTAALSKAHAAGLVHRDVKPGNILLTSDGRVKVADFGVARHKEEDVHLTQVGRVVGTIVYMAPEVAGGGEADERSDLYSLGGTFYCALTGVPPFTGTSTTQLAIQHAQAPVPPLLGKAPNTPSDFARIIHRLLSKNPADRFVSADQLLTVLGRVSQGPGPRHADAPHVDHRSLEERRADQARGSRRLVLVTMLAALAASIVLGVLFLPSRGKEGTDPQEQAVTPPPEPGTKTKPPPKAPTKKNPPKSPPKKKGTVPVRPSWTKTLADADVQSRTLLARQRFGEAIRLYTDLASSLTDDKAQEVLSERIATIRRKAQSAANAVTASASSLMRDKRYPEARQVLKPILEHYGMPTLTKAADDMLAKIDEAEADAKAEAERRKKEEEARRAAAERRHKEEGILAKASESARALARKWDFAGAASVLRQVELEDVDVRDQCERAHKKFTALAALKQKMVAKVNGAKPPLTKRAILLTGINGELVRADERGLTVRVPNNATMLEAWTSLTGRSASRLGQLSIEQNSADGWFAIALLCLQLEDMAEADKALLKAKELGANVDAYIAVAADAALAKARELVASGQADEAAAALDTIDKRFAGSAWYTAHRAEIDAARKGIAGSKLDAEAEKVYAKAAELYKKREYFELKPLVAKLRTDYATSKAVTDTTRTPSMADFVKATAKLAARLIVRKDGKSPYRTIQAAVNAAKPASLIEIQDSGPYCESINVPSSKPGLTISGAEGVWPVLTLQSGIQQYSRFFQIDAPETTIRRMVLTNPVASSSYGYESISVSLSSSSSSRLRMGRERSSTRRARTGLRLDHVLIYSARTSGYTVRNYYSRTEADHCVFITKGSFYGPHQVSNCIWLSPQTRFYTSSSSYGGTKVENCMLWRVNTSSPIEVRNCTIVYMLEMTDEPNIIVDSILGQIRATQAGTQVTHSCLFGKPPFLDFATPGDGCIIKRPGFANPQKFDFRLNRSSPCRKRASDKGDMGCRYTPEMLEMLKLAVELRSKGLVVFKF